MTVIAPRALALVPYYGSAPLAHHLALKDSGVRVIRSDGDTVDAARSILLEMAFRLPEIDVAVFVDSDIAFKRADFDALALAAYEEEGVVGGAYMTKSEHGERPRLVGHLQDPHESPLSFGAKGKLYPATRLGMGFTAISRLAYDKMAGRAHRAFFGRGSEEGTSALTLFQPMVEDGHYLREDYAFCQRALEANVPLFLDTRPTLTHYGLIGYQVGGVSP